MKLYHRAAGLLFALAALPAAAQPAAGTIRGLVVDARTGVPLEDVRVQVVGSSLGATTDAAGRFELGEVPAGRQTLHVSVVGFILVRRDVEVAAGRIVELTIPVAEGTGTYTEELTVTAPAIAEPETGVPVQQALRSAELQDLRGVVADDPMRAIQVLPGVASGDDFQAEFAVRGSDFRHIGVSLDGVATPVLMHTVRGVEDTGSIAMINSDILDEAALLAGSYPQRFGDRTGARLDFVMRDGSRDRTVARGAVSATNTSMVLEGPLGRAKRGSWLCSVRQSYLDWIIRAIDPGTTGVFGFTDVQGRVVYDLSNRQQLQASVVAGRSHYVDPEQDSVNSVEDGFNRAGLVTLAWRSLVGSSAVVTQRISAVGNTFRNDNPFGQPLADGRRRELVYRVDVSYSPAATFTLESGGELQNVRDINGRREYSRPRSGVTPVLRRDDSYGGESSRPSAYALVRWTPRQGTAFAPGVRVDQSTLIGDTTVSPWVQGELRLRGAFVLRGGAGLYQQFPDIDRVNGPQGGGPGLKAERAWHADLGIERALGPASRWRVALYDREERDMLRLPGTEDRLAGGRLIPPDANARHVNALRGYSRGVEILVQRRAPNGLSGWLSYSLGYTRYTDTRTGERFWGDFDQRHTFNAYVRQRFSNRLSVAARFRAGSNFPLRGYFERRDLYFVGDRRDTARLPVYSRLDLRASRSFDFSRRRLTLFVEVLNVFNRTNYGPADGFVRRTTGEAVGYLQALFPIVPSAGLLIEF